MKDAQRITFATLGPLDGEYGQAICLTELAATLHELGDLASAIRHYTEALDICERLGAPARQVQALAGLSRVRNDTGENELALRDAELAVKLARRSRDRRAETNAFDALARACRGLSHQGEAHEHYRKALRMAEHVGVAWDTVHVLIGLTEQQLRLKDRATALATGHRAHAMAQEHGFRLLESKAAETLGTVEADCGAGDRAFQWYRKALDIYRDIGHYAAAIRLRRSVASDVS